jgi:FAD/FMN-containing dehydrogenase
VNPTVRVVHDAAVARAHALRRHYPPVATYLAGGAYVNMMMDEGTDRIKAAYRDNYDRLVTVKNRYDPRNLFHFNQNIKPTA